MVEKAMGLGRMIVSGCTLPWYYEGSSGFNPQPQMQNLLNSLLSWAKDLSSIRVRRVITISTVDLSKTYGSDYTFSGTEFILTGALAPGESITHVDLTSNGVSASAGTGNFEISAENAIGDGGFLASNYDITYTSAGKLTVDPSELTITADAGQSKVYGDTDPRFTFTASGFKNGQDVSVITGGLSRIAGENAGTYSFTLGDIASMNYTINILPAKFTVTKALLTVTAENKSKTYGDINPTLSITCSGFKGSDDKRVLNEVPSISTTAVQYSTPGIFSIMPAGGSDDNYLFTYLEGTLTINKASLTFKADDITRDYLTSNPEMTFTISGFVNGETRSAVDLTPSIQTDAFQSSNAGTYSITLSGGNDSRYNFIFKDGIMTIEKIPQTITFSGIPEKMLVKDVYLMSASSTSGLPVLFESINSEFASVLGNECTGVSRGIAEIRAYNNGDQNYLAAEIFANIAIISTHKEILHLFSPNNDGINDTWEIPELDSYGKCDIRIFNRWGKEVYANKSYDNLWDGTSNGSPLHDGAYYYFIKSQNSGTITGTVNIVR
jgi:gliding motility-associated-like protein